MESSVSKLKGREWKNGDERGREGEGEREQRSAWNVTIRETEGERRGKKRLEEETSLEDKGKRKGGGADNGSERGVTARYKEEER